VSGRYIGRKLLQALVTIVAIVLLNFVLFRMMPGSPERQTKNPHLTPELVAANRARWGLDKPLLPVNFTVNPPSIVVAPDNQLFAFIASTAEGDLGYSIKYRGQPVIEVVAGAAGPTILLIGLGEAIAIVVGLWLGARSGWRRGGTIDRVGNALSLVFYSMPYFVIGMPLIIIFAAGLGWFPTSGMTTPGGNKTPVEALFDLGRHLVLPLTAIALGLIGAYSILMRSAIVETRSEDYITTARAKGLPDARILRSHAFPNALLPMVTLIAINLGYVVAGAITAEIVFNWPGLGTLTVQALDARDYPLLQAIFLLIAVSVVLANFAADIVYGYLDPRVRA
jgi:peptide/nickel transport system permease protein